jgi:two-component system response regulator YesN
VFNVIIVDEELTVRESLKSYFENNIDSFEVCGVFSNGEDAIKFLKDNPDTVDVVLTDIKMTTVSGILLAQMIKEYELDTIIVCSSYVKEYENVKLAIKYNAFAYIEKPIDYNELNEIFEKIKKQLKMKRKVANDAAADKQYLLTLQFLIEVYSGFFNSYEQLLNRAKTFGLGEFSIKRPCAKFTVEIEKEETEWKYGSEGKEFAIQNAFRTKGITIYNIFSTSSSMDLLAVPDDMIHSYKGDGFNEKIDYILQVAVGVLEEMGI